MSIDPEEFGLLQATRIKAVQQLTELNAQHIKSQSRLAGIEIETARCQQALLQCDSPESLESELDELGKEHARIMLMRKQIDVERDALDLEMQELEKKIAALD